MKKLKSHGFTLVEIIVSIAIASVVLMLIGTIILTSSGLLISSQQSDLDKRIGDSIIDFVRSEVQYASDVRLVTADSQYVPTESEKKDNDWHSIYVKDGRLYRDDKAVYPDDFYSVRRLEMTCQGSYENSQRLDIKYSIIDVDEVKYSTRDTIALLNFSASDEIKKQGLYTAEYKSLSQDNNQDKYIIYYNKKYNAPINVKPNSGALTGTVADIQENIFWGNCKGVYSNSGYLYNKGEIAWHNGFWWECLVNGVDTSPDSSYEWKCLDKNYTHEGIGVNNMKSGYEKNDIVIFENKYYQFIRNGVYDNESDTRISNTLSWKQIGSVGNKADEETIKQNKYEKITVYKYKTVVSRYFPSHVKMNDPSRSSVPEYDSSKKYNIGDIVRLPNFLDRQGKYYDLYIKKFDNGKAFETLNEKPNSGWVKIDTSYDGKSSYAQDDIVVLDSNDSYFVKARRDVLDVNDPSKYWDTTLHWIYLGT